MRYSAYAKVTVTVMVGDVTVIHFEYTLNACKTHFENV
jgi:hypothetical protein